MLIEICSVPAEPGEFLSAYVQLKPCSTSLSLGIYLITQTLPIPENIAGYLRQTFLTFPMLPVSLLTVRAP